MDLTEHVKTSRPDARTERWREHRLAVRGEFVDAALRAIDEHGPDVSMGDIAKEAGAAKPKLYRHFADKTDLYAAIVDHVQDLLWERIMDKINLFTDSVSHLVTLGTTEYAHVVDEHPNLFRFLVHSHFVTQNSRSGSGQDPEQALDTARQAAGRVARILTDATSEQGMDAHAAELVSYSCFGAVASATDWWLGYGRSADRVMPLETFSAYVTSIVAGVVESTCALAGVAIATDQPMHLAFSRTERE